MQHALIISRDARQQRALRRAIELEGGSAHVAENLNDAVDILERQRIRLIFLQEPLSDIDATTCISRIRNACHPDPARVIGLPEDLLASKRDLSAIGFDDVLRLPIELSDITILLSSVERSMPPVEEQEDRNSKLDATILRQLSLDLSWSTTIEQQAKHGLEAACKLFGTERGAIWVRDESDRTLTCVAQRGLSDGYSTFAGAAFNYLSQEDWVRLSRRSAFASDPATGVGVTLDLARDENLKNCLTAALFTPSSVIGALVLFDIPGGSAGSDDEFTQLIDTIAAVTAMALDQTRLRNDLSNSEETYRQLVEEMPNGVFIHDTHGNFLMSNSAIESICGFSEDDLALMNLYDLVKGGPDGPDGCALADILAEITSQPATSPEFAEMFGPITLNLVAGDGRHIEAELYFRALRLRGREDENWIQAVARDVTNEARAFRELEALRGVAESLTGIDDDYQALREVLVQIKRSIGYLHASIWMLSPDGRELICKAQSGIEYSELLSDPDDGFIGEVLRSLASRHDTDIEHLPENARVHKLVTEVAIIPIHSDTRVQGVLQIQTGVDRQMNPVDIDFLESVSTQIAGRIGRLELIQQIAMLESIDPTTGLDNRRKFHMRLEDAFKRSQSKPLSLLHLGIDGFKSFNDTYGHLVGDDLLLQVAITIQSYVPPHFPLARYGGDEFCAILPGIGRDEVSGIAEKIRIGVATQLFKANDQLEQMTVSIGAATLPDDVGNITRLVSAAYDATSMAKQAGRNQVYQSNSAFGELSMQRDQLVKSLHRSPQNTLSLLVRAMDERIPERNGHASRVARLAMSIGDQLGVDGEELDHLGVAAYMHDIGMFLIPDELLRKPIDLSKSERERLAIIPAVAHRLLSNVALPTEVSLAVVHQYEHWDGSGHPGRLAGTSIPLAARIIAVADGIDAMTSPRAHREPMAIPDVLDSLRNESGTRFDPDVVAAAELIYDESAPEARDVKTAFLRDSLELLGV